MAKYDYTPSRIARMKESDVRKLYSEYRKIANKRAQRMRAAGYSKYEAARKEFAKTKDLNEAEVRAAFAEVNKYLRDIRTKLKPLRAYQKGMIEQLHEHGYDFVDETNIKEFGDFMEWSRARSGSNDRIFKSDRAADLFNRAAEEGISADKLKKNFESYRENFNKTGRILTQRRKRPDAKSDDEYRSRFEHRRRK